MSGLVKGVGKVFKAVVKVVKKIALPVLAIGAVVLTGGAALGALPSLTSMVGSLGLSPALSGILVGAAKGATAGFIGGVLTGADPIKAAGTGLMLGGALSGIGALAGGAKTAATVANGASETANAAAGTTAAGQVANAGAGAMPSAAAATGGAGGIGAAAAAPAAAAPSLLTGTTAGSGGFLGWLNANPVVGGSLIQGIGAGISQNEVAKREQQMLEQLSRNYDGYSGLTQGTDPNAPYTGKVAYDQQTGRIVRVGA